MITLFNTPLTSQFMIIFTYYIILHNIKSLYNIIKYTVKSIQIQDDRKVMQPILKYLLMAAVQYSLS
jgi:hypothetical protein